MADLTWQAKTLHSLMGGGWTLAAARAVIRDLEASMRAGNAGDAMGEDGKPFLGVSGRDPIDWNAKPPAGETP